MNRATAARAGLAIVLLVAAGYAALTSAPRLGLDLRGGTQPSWRPATGPA